MQLLAPWIEVQGACRLWGNHSIKSITHQQDSWMDIIRNGTYVLRFSHGGLGRMQVSAIRKASNRLNLGAQGLSVSVSNIPAAFLFGCVGRWTMQIRSNSWPVMYSRCFTSRSSHRLDTNFCNQESLVQLMGRGGGVTHVRNRCFAMKFLGMLSTIGVIFLPERGSASHQSDNTV